MIHDSVMSVAAALLFLIVLTPLIMMLASKHGVIGPAVFALVSRLIWGFSSFWIFGLSASDAHTYDRWAVALATGNEDVVITPGKAGLSITLSYIYRWFGYSPEIGLVLNAAAASLVPIVVALTCRSLEMPRAVKPAAWLVAAFPAAIPWTSFLARESIVALLLALALLGAAWIRSGRMGPGVAILLSSSLLMLSFRGGLAYVGAVVLPGVLVLEALLSRRFQLNTRILIPVVAAIVLILTLPLISSVSDQASYFDWDQQQQKSAGLNRGTTSLDEEGSPGETTAEVSSDGPFEGLIQGIRRLPSTSVGPFPWNWRNPQLVLAGLDGLLWAGIWILTFYGWRASSSKFAAALCVVPTALLLAYIGTVGTNFGLVMRLRVVGLPLLAPVVGLGMVAVWDTIARRRNRMQLPESHDELQATGTTRRSTPPPA